MYLEKKIHECVGNAGKNMKSLLNILKIAYCGAQTEHPVHVFLQAPSGHGKSHVLKKFCESNKYTVLIHNEDITADQLRKTIADATTGYLCVIDDILFRDDRQKKNIITMLASLAEDGAHHFSQKDNNQTIQTSASFVLSFNDNQVASMQSILQEKGVDTRFFPYKFFLEKNQFPAMRKSQIPVVCEFDKIEYAQHNMTIQPYGFDFRSTNISERIYNIGKNIGLTDADILDIFSHRQRKAIIPISEVS
jgi:hypothetical protein